MSRTKVPEDVRLRRQRFTGSRIRRVREAELKLTQVELAAKVGLRGDRGLSDIERGINAIDIYRLYDLSRLSGYAMEYFVSPSYKPTLRIKPETPR